jgi:serine/threonine protein kinase
LAIEVRFGRYQLLKRIAQGGMAEVYLAQQSGPAGFSKKLVIKKIHPHLAHNEEFVGMFLDEARVAALLAHPNIGQIYELGEEHGQYYIAMEFIDGCNLRQLNKCLRRKGVLMPPELAACVASNVCAGLDFAHRFKDGDNQPLRIVHRDVSPQNVMLSRDGAVKLIDFGIAKASTNQQLTQGNVLKGKFSYMSPEQAGGKKLDRRSDIFSLGVLLYEMLLGEKPFKVPGEIGKKRTDNTELLRRITRCEFRMPSSGQVPEPLRQVLERALTQHRGDRYQTAREMRDALDQAIRHMPGDGSNRRLARFVEELMGSDEGGMISTSLPSLESSLASASGPEEFADPMASTVAMSNMPHALASQAPDMADDDPATEVFTESVNAGQIAAAEPLGADPFSPTGSSAVALDQTRIRVSTEDEANAGESSVGTAATRAVASGLSVTPILLAIALGATVGVIAALAF